MIAIAVILASFILGLLIGLVGMQLTTDPYGCYRRETLWRRPAILLLDREFVARVLRTQPGECVIVGTSDVLSGLADHRDLLGGVPVVCGIQAGRMTELSRFAIAAAKRPHTREVILALDLVSFNGRPGRARGFDPGLLPDARLSQRLAAEIRLGRRTIADGQALTDAVTTRRDPSGAWLRARYDLPFDLEFHPNGSATYTYLLNDDEPMWFLLERHRHLPWLLGDYSIGTHELDAFSELVEHPVFENIELTLYFHPCHPAQWLLIEELGLWPTLEDWKSELARRCGASRVPPKLYDLTRFDGAWELPVGAEHHGALIDSVHLTATGGELVLDELRGQTARSTRLPVGADAGGRLRAHFEAIRAARDSYRERHPVIGDRVARIAATPRKRRVR